MHGENLKLIDARQAKVCNIYKNTKLKLRVLKTNAAVNHYESQSSTALYSLMMDHIRSETCRNDF